MTGKLKYLYIYILYIMLYIIYIIFWRNMSSTRQQSKHLFFHSNDDQKSFYEFVFQSCICLWTKLSWQKMTHVNYLNNSFLVSWLASRPLAVKSCHSPVTVEGYVNLCVCVCVLWDCVCVCLCLHGVHMVWLCVCMCKRMHVCVCHVSMCVCTRI